MKKKAIKKEAKIINKTIRKSSSYTTVGDLKSLITNEKEIRYFIKQLKKVGNRSIYVVKYYDYSHDHIIVYDVKNDESFIAHKDKKFIKLEHDTIILIIPAYGYFDLFFIEEDLKKYFSYKNEEIKTLFYEMIKLKEKINFNNIRQFNAINKPTVIDELFFACMAEFFYSMGSPDAANTVVMIYKARYNMKKWHNYRSDEIVLFDKDSFISRFPSLLQRQSKNTYKVFNELGKILLKKEYPNSESLIVDDSFTINCLLIDNTFYIYGKDKYDKSYESKRSYSFLYRFIVFNLKKYGRREIAEWR